MTLLVCAFLIAQLDQASTRQPLPERALALYEKGAAGIEEGDYLAACQSLEQLVNQFPESAAAEPAQVSLAECLIALDRPQEAFDRLDPILEMDETPQPRLRKVAAHAALRISRAHEDREDYEAAEEWATEAYELARTLEKRGVNRLEEEDLRLLALANLIRIRARICQRRLLEDNEIDSLITSYPIDQRPLVRYTLAEALLATGHHRLSEAQFAKLPINEESSPWQSSLLLRRAELHLALNQIGDAKRLISESRAAWTNTSLAPRFHYLLARISIREIEFDQARLALDEILLDASVPATFQAQAQWMRGEIRFLQRDFEKAIGEYRKVGEFETPDWIARAELQMAKCLELTGKSHQAIEIYQRLVAAGPENPGYEPSLSRIALLIEPGETAGTENTNPPNQPRVR